MTVRVLHVLDHSLPEVSGYSIRSHSVLRTQRACGIDACALVRTSRVSRRTEHVIDGVPYVWLPGGATDRPATWRSSVSRMARLAPRLGREVRERQITVLHAHSPSLNGIPALWVATRFDLPLVYEMRALWEAAAVDRHAGRHSAPRQRAARALETWLIRRVAALIVISQGLHDEAVRRGVRAERLFRAPNGVDPDRFRPMPPDTHLLRHLGLEGHLVFGYLGFFFAYEGVDVLLQAFPRVAAALPQSRLLLVGSGEQERVLRALARALGIASKVVFAGAVPHEDVRRWYSVCDVLVYPRRAGKTTMLVTPLKPLEAMAMGKAVVATAVGGLQELIRHGETGVLCRADNARALATALADLGAAPGRRDAIGTHARRFVCEQRNWTRLGPFYERVYGGLLRSRRHRAG